MMKSTKIVMEETADIENNSLWKINMMMLG